jgi:hypothetical protein
MPLLTRIAHKGMNMHAIGKNKRMQARLGAQLQGPHV